MVNIPKFKMPTNPIKTREDGVKIIGGQSAQEWFVSVGVLIILWVVMGCIFAGLIAVAQTVRDKGVLYDRPTTGCLHGQPGCNRAFPGLTVCGVAGVSC